MPDLSPMVLAWHWTGTQYKDSVHTNACGMAWCLRFSPWSKCSVVHGWRDRMPGPFLYSVNPLLKFEITRDFFGHRHFVWCADCFDARDHRLHAGAKVPPSSNPAELYAAIWAATIDRPDGHNHNIRDWRQGMKDRAIKLAAAGTIDAKAEADVIYLLDHAEMRQWRPLLCDKSCGGCGAPRGGAASGTCKPSFRISSSRS
jgi:hypothetical protein